METYLLYLGYGVAIISGWLSCAVIVYYAFEWTYKAYKNVEGALFVYRAVREYKKDKYMFNEAELEYLEKRQKELLTEMYKQEEAKFEEYKRTGFPKVKI